MPLNPLAGIADNVLASFVARTVQAGMTREAFTSLFLPETFRDQTTQLSSTELVSLLLGSRRALVGLSTAAERLDIASPLALFHGAGVSSSNSAAVSAEITAGISSSSRPETATYSFTVAQVALAQANVGSALSSNAVTAFTAGTNTARFVQKVQLGKRVTLVLGRDDQGAVSTRVDLTVSEEKR